MRSAEDPRLSRQACSGNSEAVTIGYGKIGGHETVIGVCDPGFMIGSVGHAMGAFNLWVKGTALEKAENCHVGEVASLLLNSCAYHYMKNLLVRMGADSALFANDIL